MLLYACRNIIESFGLWHKVAENVDNYCKILLRSTLRGHTGDGNWPNYWNDITRGDVFLLFITGFREPFRCHCRSDFNDKFSRFKTCWPTNDYCNDTAANVSVCPETVLHCTSDNAVKSRDHVITLFRDCLHWLSPWTSDAMTFTLCLFVYKHFTDWDRASV